MELLLGLCRLCVVSEGVDWLWEVELLFRFLALDKVRARPSQIANDLLLSARLREPHMRMVSRLGREVCHFDMHNLCTFHVHL